MPSFRLVSHITHRTPLDSSRSERAQIPLDLSTCSPVISTNHQVVNIHHRSTTNNSNSNNHNYNHNDRSAHVPKVTPRPHARPPFRHQAPSPTCRDTTRTTTPSQRARGACITPNPSPFLHSTLAADSPSAATAIRSPIKLPKASRTDRDTIHHSPTCSHTRRLHTSLPLIRA